MKYLNPSFLSAAVILLGSLHPAVAQDTAEKPPNTSFGIAGSYNYYSAWLRKKSDQYSAYNLAPGYGGGVVFEKDR
ncbi:MAG: hypothetical protein A2W19_12255 [Spirochaetes bacterium RBG_16_49_21]|nr:MAG: hypothetical protein A2W19_12255 [Spirochaetes bacterium RBG_16_49_21]